MRDTSQRVAAAAGVPNWRFGPRTVVVERPEDVHEPNGSRAVAGVEVPAQSKR